MNNGVSCPDCNSQDIQEKVKSLKITTSNKNWKGFFLVLLIGFVGLIIASRSEGFGLMIFFLVVPIPLGLFILFKGSVKDRDESYQYYICRSCGREFHKD